ncbi:MAG: flap endonuclease [Actinomycetota bacterium]|nr:flap endonuclease [Actinomycetota bacterium]
MSDRASGDSLTLLIDAPSLFYRALFSSPETISTPDGRPINAAYGFFNMLAQLIRDRDPDFIGCAADGNWRPEWRVRLLDGYKASRAGPGSPQEKAEELLAHQVPIIYELLELCGIAVAGHPEFEAEDIVGTWAVQAPGRVEIFSGDRDLWQLVEDPRCSVLYPIRGVSVIDVVDESYITEKCEIPGRAYRDFAVLRGDPSDGLPGVRGIGKKMAAALLTRYGSIDAIIAAAEQGGSGGGLAKVRRELDYVRKAVEVVTIATDVPLPPMNLERPHQVPPEVTDRAAAYGLQSPIKRLVAALAHES